MISPSDVNLELSYEANVREPDESTIQEYVEWLKDNEDKDFPPLEIWEVPGDADAEWVAADGLQRLIAYQRDNREEIPVVINVGSMEDAKMASAAANVSHGRRRTTADKRAAVQAVLDLHEDWSSRQVAEWCSVSHTFVEKIRKEGEVDPTDPLGVNDQVATTPPDVAANGAKQESAPKKKIAKTARVGKDGKKQSATKSKVGKQKEDVKLKKEGRDVFGKLCRIAQRGGFDELIKDDLESIAKKMKW